MLLVVVLAFLCCSVTGADVCPPTHTVCYPGDCCPQYRQCDGERFFDPKPTAAGTVCKGGYLVHARDCTTPCPSVPAPCNLSQIFAERDFNTLFPFHNGGANNNVTSQYPIFNYADIITAAKSFPEFGCTGDLALRKRELSAFLAQTSQETSGWWAGQPYYWGYYFSTEIGCTNDVCTSYCEPSTTYPCAPGKGYFGRGPIQLSWNYNYGQMSQALFGNDTLLLEPDLVLTSGVIAFKTAFWFWMTPQAPKPSCHDVITGNWVPSSSDVAVGRLPGFGMTTNIINGRLECNKNPSPQSVQTRIGYFNTYTSYFNTTSGNNLDCNATQPYSS